MSIDRRIQSRIAAIILFTFFLATCTDPRFPEFTQTKNGLWYKLVDISDSEKKARTGDYITVQMVIRSEKDSILYDTRTIGLNGSVTFILDAPQHEKDYREGFQLISEGDSAEFITDAHTFYMRKNNTPVPAGMAMESIIKVQVRVQKVRTPDEHAAYIAEENRRIENGEFEEKKVLDKYMADSSIAAQLLGNGMYYIRLEEGRGLTPDSGRVALVNYRGSFLNGRCFDFFYESQPFEYQVGAEEQLIKGLETGVRRMHEGEKAKFIIPSHLAFGSAGSSTGIVPPFTTVIYEVELLKVQ